MVSPNHCAFVTFLMLNESYLPGALLQGYSLAEHAPDFARICLVTEEVSDDARTALGSVFDHIVPVEKIYVPHRRRQARQDRPFLLTRLQALRLGPDGDLGHRFRKIVLLDADILPLKRLDQLFMLPGPAGVLNERKSHFVATDSQGRYAQPTDVDITGRWIWHEVYGGLGHGRRIPAAITDRPRHDPANLGVNTALMVLEPSQDEYLDMLEEISRPDTVTLLSETFDWPDMQYLTLRWSGRWVNVDASFCGFRGYPSLAALCATHFAGVKPWASGNSSWGHYSQFPDFRYWHRRFLELMARHPELSEIKRLARLSDAIRRLRHKSAR